MDLKIAYLNKKNKDGKTLPIINYNIKKEAARAWLTSTSTFTKDEYMAAFTESALRILNK